MSFGLKLCEECVQHWKCVLLSLARPPDAGTIDEAAISEDDYFHARYDVIVRFVFLQAPEAGQRCSGASKDGRGGEAGPS